MASFDERAGWGTLTSTSGESLFFHCVEIRGGSRSIDVGTRVWATRVAGQRGRDEAADVRPMSSEIS